MRVPFVTQSKEELAMMVRLAKVGTVVVIVVLVGLMLAKEYHLSSNNRPVYGTNCNQMQGLVSQNDAEAKAKIRADLSNFKKNGGDPDIISSQLDTIAVIQTAFDVAFNDELSTTTCVWYVVMSGSVNAEEVVSIPGATATPGGTPEAYKIMEVGINATSGDLLTETFVPSSGGTPTFEPTPTGTQATPYAVPTVDVTPIFTPTP